MLGGQWLRVKNFAAQTLWMLHVTMLRVTRMRYNIALYRCTTTATRRSPGIGTVLASNLDFRRAPAVLTLCDPMKPASEGQ